MARKDQPGSLRRAGFFMLIVFDEQIAQRLHRFRRDKPMSALHVMEASGIVLISGIPSQESALHICEHFLTWGVKATIGADADGYQVSAHRISVERVKALLGQLEIETD